jgi:hypothetical protein
MAFMLVTASVFHALILALKALALKNMLSMFVTTAVFHPLISALKVSLFAKSPFMSVTGETSQVSISPQFTPTPQMSGFAA